MTSDVTPKQGIEFFGEQASRWEGLYRTKPAFSRRLSLFTRVLREILPNGGRVLDFGCGPGVMTLGFAEDGYEVVGMDGARLMVESARAAQKNRGISQARFIQMDADSFEPMHEQFDAVVCSSVLEYLQDDRGLLRKLSESMRTGGSLLISVPHTFSVLGAAERLLWYSSKIRKRVGRKHLEYSLRRYSVSSLVEQLRDFGLHECRRLYFETPIPGTISASLSRTRALALMVLIVAEKKPIVTWRRTSNTQSKQSSTQRALSRKNVWAATPPMLRRTLGQAISFLGPKALFGKQYVQTLGFLRESEHWPKEKLGAYQLQQLRRICTLAVESSPFYAAAAKRIGFDPRDLTSLDDFQSLPLITKETVRKSLRDMCVVNPNSRRVDYVATGGTGGQPVGFFIGADRSAIEHAYLMMSWSRIGYAPGRPMAVLRGQVVQEDRSGMRHEYEPTLKHHVYSTFHLTDDNIGRYLEHIRSLGDCFLHVYPSSVDRLARYVLRSGIRAPANVKAIITESETVYDEQRQVAANVFGCRYFSCYGHTEKLVLAAECEHTTDLHVWPTYGFFELLAEDGSPVTTPGQRGEIVGTGFINRIVPFIRYRTGDYATYVAHRCEACGREHTLIRDIQGHRTQETLVTTDGAHVPWTALNMHDDTFLRVRQFQFYQDTPGVACLRIVTAPGYSDVDEARIRDRLARKLDERLEISFEYVDAIPLAPSGKAIYVEQKLTLDKNEVAPF